MNAPGGRNTVSPAPQQSERSYRSRSSVQLSPDFVVLDGLTIRARVVIGNIPGRRDAPALLPDLEDAAKHNLVDHLLALGYRLRIGPQTSASDDPQLVYARADESAPSATLHVEGLLELKAGARFRVPRLALENARLGNGAILDGSMFANGNVELEEGAVVTGNLVTQGELIMHENAAIHGSVQAGRASFFSEGRRVVSSLDPIVLQPVPPLPRPEPVEGAEPIAAATGVAETVTTQTVVTQSPPPPPPVDAPKGPVDVSVATTFEQAWPGAALPGRYRIIVWATLRRDQIAPVLRGHWESAGTFLEVEVLEVEGRNVSLLAHPSTPRQRRIRVDVNELASDDVITTLLPILQRVSTLRVLYKDDMVMAAASVESVRWLITVFGKMLRLDTRLQRLVEMRLFSLDELARPTTERQD